jgi:hypothetical protein
MRLRYQTVSTISKAFPSSTRPYVMPQYMNFTLTSGPGERNSDCLICQEVIEANTPSIMHTDGKCKNTYCKPCFNNWIRCAPTEPPTCPACRASIIDTETVNRGPRVTLAPNAIRHLYGLDSDSEVESRPLPLPPLPTLPELRQLRLARFADQVQSSSGGSTRLSIS